MEPPASFTQVSKSPKRSTAASARSLTSCLRVTSVGTARASLPICADLIHKLHEGFIVARGKHDLGAARAAMRAVLSPMPLVAPVITTTCSDSFFNWSFIAPAEYRGRDGRSV